MAFWVHSYASLLICINTLWGMPHFHEEQNDQMVRAHKQTVDKQTTILGGGIRYAATKTIFVS